MRDRKDSFVAYLVLLLCVIASPVVGQSVEWPSYASDVSGSKYSPLDQINPSGMLIDLTQICVG